MLTWTSTNQEFEQFNKLLRIYRKICPPPPENISDLDLLYFNSLTSVGCYDAEDIAQECGIKVEELVQFPQPMPPGMGIVTALR